MQRRSNYHGTMPHRPLRQTAVCDASAAHADLRLRVARGGAGLLLALAIMPWLAGCATTPPVVTEEPTLARVQVADREAFFDNTLSLLRQCDLPAERIDRSAGLIVTKPTTSGQWFEPWRVDAQGAGNVLESSLHTISRTVTIRLRASGASGDAPADALGSAPAPADPLASAPAPADRSADADGAAPRYVLSVDVQKSRFQTPERQVTTASGALAMFSDSVPTTEGVREQRSGRAHWRSLGRDARLEQYLLARILALPEVQPAPGAAE